MSKTSSLLVLLSCVIVGAGVLTGCSSGALPGGTSAGTAASSAPSQPATKPAPDADDLTAVPKDCPKASEVSALVGFTVADPDPTRSSAGLACTYAGSEGANDMEINFHSAPSGTTVDSVKAELASGDSTVPVTPVPGLGDAAFSVTPPEGGAGLLVWNKGVEFSVVDAHDVDGLRRVALGILAG